MNKLKRAVLRDCTKASAPSAIFYTLESLLSSLLSVYTAMTLGKFADAVFKLDFDYGIANFWRLLACVGIMLIVDPLLGMIGEVLQFKCSLTHDRMIYGRYLDKKYREATAIPDGEVQYRLENDAIDLRCNWVDLVTKYITIPVTAVYLMYNSLKISVIYTAITLLVTAIKLTVPIAVRKLNQKYDAETREYRTAVRTYETEMTTQPHTVKLYGLSSALIQKLDGAYRTYFRDVFSKSVKCSSVAGGISGMLDTFCTMLILLSGTILMAYGKITSGDITAVIGFFGIYNSLIGDIGSLIRDTPVFGTVVERMTMFYKDEEDLSGKTVGEAADITFEGASFSYDDREILSNVSLKIKYGAKTAICGPNGSGKSTLIKLTCGLLKDYSGHIRVGNDELSAVSMTSWREKFAYTEQDPYLFSGTVRENIRLGNLRATEDELDEVIRAVGVEYLADREVTRANNSLSGGEKQKISIARALLKNTPVLIMDEPSNNLDEVSLRWLCEFIRRSDKTVVYISHDPELTAAADDVVNLQSCSAS